MYEREIMCICAYVLLFVHYTDRKGRRTERERQRVYSKRLKLIGSRGRVTLSAQNRPKLGRRRPWRSLAASGARRETERTASD
jgi:hypothetical protein